LLDIVAAVEAGYARRNVAVEFLTIGGLDDEVEVVLESISSRVGPDQVTFSV
jgi:hypothetical protein